MFYNAAPEKDAIYDGCHECGALILNESATRKHTDIEPEEVSEKIIEERKTGDIDGQP